MRLFAAIDVPADVKAFIARLPASRVPPNGAHITLKFLGEVPDDSGLLIALAGVRPPAFDITLDRYGEFPGRVIFLDGPPNAAFMALADAVHVVTNSIPRDHDPAIHATIARTTARLRDLTLPAVGPFTWRVTEFVLYRSAHGAYEAVRRFPLTG